MKTIIRLAATFVFLIGFTLAKGQLTYTVTDLGTLGGNTTTANNVTGHGQNAAGMIVGSSTTSDNSEHAFLYIRDKMYDLNTLCDLSQTEFKVLTVARTISDSCVIIGDGITKNGDKHAFKMTPIGVAGGQWFYDCCQWIWKQDGGGWWWEEDCGCYKWHGPPGKHPPCPPQPPPCWNWPLPCCPECPPPPPPTTPTPPGDCWCCIKGVVRQTTVEDCRAHEAQCYPTREEAERHCKDLCWCCLNGRIVEIDLAECRARGGQCFSSREEALRHCGELCWCCINGEVRHTTVEDCHSYEAPCYPTREEAARSCRPGRTPTPPPRQTPTPPRTNIPGVQPTPTPPPRRTPTPSRRHPSPTPHFTMGRQTPTPSRRQTPYRTPSRKKPTPTPSNLR